MSNYCTDCEGKIRVNYHCDEDNNYTCNDCYREYVEKN